MQSMLSNMNEEHAKYARLEFFSINTVPQILFYWHLFGASKPRYQNSQVPLFLLIWRISLATATAPPCDHEMPSPAGTGRSQHSPTQAAPQPQGLTLSPIPTDLETWALQGAPSKATGDSNLFTVFVQTTGTARLRPTWAALQNHLGVSVSTITTHPHLCSCRSCFSLLCL